MIAFIWIISGCIAFIMQLLKNKFIGRQVSNIEVLGMIVASIIFGPFALILLLI